jgi:hypothetical protein
MGYVDLSKKSPMTTVWIREPKLKLGAGRNEPYMSNIIRYDDESDVEVLTRSRGRLAGTNGLEFLRYLDRDAAQVAEKALFEQSALEALAPAVREMAAGAAETVLSEMRQGATYAEVDFDVKASSDHWTFFGFSGEGHNVRVTVGIRARSNKPR